MQSIIIRFGDNIMRKTVVFLIAILIIVLTLSGCTNEKQQTHSSAVTASTAPETTAVDTDKEHFGDYVDFKENTGAFNYNDAMEYLYTILDSYYISSSYSNITIGTYYDAVIGSSRPYYRLTGVGDKLIAVYDIQKPPYMGYFLSNSMPIHVDDETAVIYTNSTSIKGTLLINDFPHLIIHDRISDMEKKEHYPITEYTTHGHLGANSFSYGSFNAIEKIDNTVHMSIDYKDYIEEKGVFDIYFPDCEYFYSQVTREVKIIFPRINFDDENDFIPLANLPGIEDFSVTTTDFYDEYADKYFPTTIMQFTVADEYDLYGEIIEELEYHNNTVIVDSKMILYTKLLIDRVTY